LSSDEEDNDNREPILNGGEDGSHLIEEVTIKITIFDTFISLSLYNIDLLNEA